MQGASLMGFSSPPPVLKATDADDDDAEPTPSPESPKRLPAKKPQTELKLIKLSSDKDTKGQGKKAPKDKKDSKCKKGLQVEMGLQCRELSL